jgi:hypothetical protein
LYSLQVLFLKYPVVYHYTVVLVAVIVAINTATLALLGLLLLEALYLNLDALKATLKDTLKAWACVARYSGYWVDSWVQKHQLNCM